MARVLTPILRQPWLLLTIIAAIFNLGANAAFAPVWQYWQWPDSTTGYPSVDQTVTVSATGPTRFFSHQIWFKNGSDAAYMGIQETANGKIGIFSLWNSPGNAKTGSSGSYCLLFDNEGSGWSCRIPYNWIAGRSYRLRMRKIKGKADGSIQYGGFIQDMKTEKETVIGYLWTAPGQGLLMGSVSWIEDYGGNNCTLEKPARGTFSKPKMDGVRASFGQSTTAACGSHVSTIKLLGDEAILSQ
jgi:hypothetical protein